jgi:hypothetical protein
MRCIISYNDKLYLSDESGKFNKNLIIKKGDFIKVFTEIHEGVFCESVLVYPSKFNLKELTIQK